MDITKPFTVFCSSGEFTVNPDGTPADMEEILAIWEGADAHPVSFDIDEWRENSPNAPHADELSMIDIYDLAMTMSDGRKVPADMDWRGEVAGELAASKPKGRIRPFMRLDDWGPDNGSIPGPEA